MKKSFIAIICFIFAIFAAGKVWASTLAPEADVSSISPMFTVTPSDGGSDSSSPSNAGEYITFTATAEDMNNNQYYLAICETDAISTGDNAAPTCTGGDWAISTATNSGSQASVQYEVLGTETCGDTCAWYAFVCDKVSGGGSCYPAGGSGDQGQAVAVITFSGVPVDAATITVGSTVHEFDTDDDGISSGTEVDTSASDFGTDAAEAFVNAYADGTTLAVRRTNKVYIYAISEGTVSISLAESGDTGSAISLSDASLQGGSDTNASPFAANQIGTFGSITTTDASDGTIEPGDQIKFTLAFADMSDPDGDDMQMHICTSATTSFDYDNDTCTDGAWVCSSSVVDPTSTDATCTESAANLAPIPTAHGSHNFKVFVEDDNDSAATGTNTQSFTVQDVPPTWVSYTASDDPSITVGGTDDVDFSAVISDDNGEADVTAVEGYFFNYDTVSLVSGACTEDTTECYRDATCTLNTGYGTSSQVEAQCSVDVYFNADESNNWEIHVNASDELGMVTSYGISDANRSVSALSGISVVSATIDYGTLAPGTVSSTVTASIGNAGNQVIDATLHGTDMCSDPGTCLEYTIDKGQQKWAQADGSSFSWASQGHALLGSSSAGDADTNGCINLDLAVRADATQTTENENIYWILRVPEQQENATYTGTNTLSYISSSSCTGTP